MKKSLATVGVTAAVALTSIAGIGVAHADTSNSSSSSGPMSSLATAIAKKFNLKTADVQAVFDEQHKSMEETRTAEVKSKLTQLVSDGELTQSQADAILTKRAELQQQREANRDSMRDKTMVEHKASMDATRTSLSKWLDDNDIPSDYRHLVLGSGHGHSGPGGMRIKHPDVGSDTQ